MNSKQYIKMAVQNLYLPAVYAIYRHKKTDPQAVIFADAHHDSRPANFDLLYEELSARGYHIREMYLDYQKASAGTMIRHMNHFMKEYARAGTVVLCDNFLPTASCRKKKETHVVQLWHACGALKKFGYDTADDIPAGYKGNVFRGIDLVTVSSPACEAPFASAMKLPRDHVRALGVSRSDRLYDQTLLSSQKERFLERYPEAAGKKIVIWAPTFRGSAGDPKLLQLDLTALQRALGEGYYVAASLHPHMKMTGDRIVSFHGEDLLGAADLLIADYSSIVFEYACLRKPMVFYVPDLQEYTEKRGFYLSFSELPGEKVTDQDKLADAIRRAFVQNGEKKQEASKDKYEAFLKKYMSACDGHATKRIADAIDAWL